MSKITIKTDDTRKAEALVRFLREIPDITITMDSSSTAKDPSHITRLFGLWKDRTIDLAQIRERAWNRK
ncbi:MAG TPA: hypothetical protein PK253_19350 [Spirochaetota bacterium]|nr:hypothetical protein [Spirochaetota bacterium]